MASNYPAILPSYPYQQLISAPNLTGIIQMYKTGVIDPLPPAAYIPGPKERVHGNTAMYTMVFGQRQVATRSAYGATPKKAQMIPRGVKSVILNHVAESISIVGNDYLNLISPDSLERQSMGMQEITMQIGMFKARASNLRIAMTLQALFAGAVAFDNTGNILTTGTTAAANGTNISYEVPNGSTGVTVTPYVTTIGNQIGRSIDPFGTGTPIAGGALASWAVASTAIDSQMEAMVQSQALLTGFEFKHAFFGKNIPHYLRTNGTTQYYFARTPNYNPAVVQRISDIPDGTLGIEKWHNCMNASYMDQTGTIQKIAGDDQIVLTPEFDNTWWGFLEGSAAKPREGSIVNSGEAQAVVNASQEMFGRFAYGVETQIPAGVEIALFDTCLPIIKNPQCIFIVTVV